MLNKIKNFWQNFKTAIIAGAIALAYLIGKKRGKEYEKTRQDKAVLANVARADSARSRLGNPRTARRLQDKYGRK